MTANSPTGADGPLSSTEAPAGRPAHQLAFFPVEDPAWVVFLLDRLKEGDVVLVDRAGDFIFLDPPLDMGNRLDT